VYAGLFQFATVVCKLPTYSGPALSLGPKPKTARFVQVEAEDSVLPNLDEKKV
jgi:hypothetical protein